MISTGMLGRAALILLWSYQLFQARMLGRINWQRGFCSFWKTSQGGYALRDINVLENSSTPWTGWTSQTCSFRPTARWSPKRSRIWLRKRTFPSRVLLIFQRYFRLLELVSGILIWEKCIRFSYNWFQRYLYSFLFNLYSHRYDIIWPAPFTKSPE